MPHATLGHHISGKSKKIGAGVPTAIPESMEKYLVDGVILSAELGWPLNRCDIKHVIKTYCMKMKVDAFKNAEPGDDWMAAFQKRWKSQLSVRAAETLTKSRASGLTREVLDLFYDGFERKLDELGIKDRRGRIFNLDETGMCTKASSKGLFFRRGTKEAQVIAPTEGRTMFTVLFCCNASGDFLPPYVVYKGTPGILQTSWMSGGPTGTSYNATKSGWMEDYVFEAWFRNSFLTWLDQNDVRRPVMLLFDGHGSHLTYTLAQMAADNQVTLYCLPPHTSSKLQPLDVGVYGPLKTHWSLVLRDYYRESRLQNVKKEGFPSLLNKVFQFLVSRPGNAANAFAACGLCPLDKSAIPDSSIIASTPFASAPAQSSSSSTSRIPSPPMTPRKAMRTAIVELLSPAESASTTAAILAGKRTRKRVQIKTGESLTEPGALERLRIEQEEREEKKRLKKGKATAGQAVKGSGQVVKKKKKVANKKLTFVDDSSDEESSADEFPTMPCEEEKEEREKKKQLKKGKATPEPAVAGNSGLVVKKKKRDVMQKVTYVEESSADEGNVMSSIGGSSSDDELVVKEPPSINTADWDKNNVDKFVAAVYDGKWYLAVVVGYDEILEDVKLRFMAPEGPTTKFNWPNHPDMCTLPTKDILCLLHEPPAPTSSRMCQFSITENCMDKIDAKYARYVSLN